MTSDELRRRVVEWIALDPDPGDDEALVKLLDEFDDGRRADTLEQLFNAPELNFGTAGLRGPMQPGPGGMNRATVRFATLGVLGWMKETGLDPSKGVVVGRDGRHHSESFNDEVVRVLLADGVRVFEMPGPLPTPLVAYCVKALSAAAGIMVTASHNPPNDNGYKLYASDGAQIIPPDDEIVERHMRLAVTSALGDRRARDALTPRSETARVRFTPTSRTLYSRTIEVTSSRDLAFPKAKNWQSRIHRCMVSGECR